MLVVVSIFLNEGLKFGNDSIELLEVEIMFDVEHSIL